MVVQLGRLLSGPADQPHVDIAVAAQEPVPAAFGVDRDGMQAGVYLGGDLTGQRGEVGEDKRRGGVQQHGRTPVAEADERGRTSARATALVEMVGAPSTPDLSEDGSQRHSAI